VYEEKTKIVETVVKVAEKAIADSNNKDKEVFDGQTIEAKENMLVEAKKKTETLATDTLWAEKKAYADQRNLENAKEEYVVT
jgi:hypothetical protein